MAWLRCGGTLLALAGLLACTEGGVDDAVGSADGATWLPAPDASATGGDAAAPSTPAEDAAASSPPSDVAALCMALATESDCAAATVACRTYGLEGELPYEMIECGTSVADGSLSPEALRCMLDASAAEQAFILVTLNRWGLEGELDETAWLGVRADGRYQRFAIRASGGGLVTREVTRQPCTAITADQGAPRCEGDGEHDALCTDPEYHWVCLPYFSEACDGGVGSYP